MIEHISFSRFKQFRDSSIGLTANGVTLVAGGNNAGKSTLLQGLAVWQFCRTAIEMEQGDAALRQGSRRQGLGVGDDEFSPIAVPSLKHLWANLRTREADDPDGYTLRIGLRWQTDRSLEFGLALVNDRLYIKPTKSTLTPGDPIPVVAYLPPFAGIAGREQVVSGAIRRRRIGEGLAGAVLRNLLLEMFNVNSARRAELRGTRSKIRDIDLRELRATDPWEVLQDTLRRRFGVELLVRPFREEYHSYIRIDVDRGEVDGYQLKRHPNYNPRDLMVEGSGFLQWLSVYALAVSPDVDVLLLDEPDAHLHPALQAQLVESISELSQVSGTQVLIATHSSELLKNSPAERILEVRSGGRRAHYLANDDQKVGLLAGLGSDYSPRIHRLHKTKRMLFLEGSIDRLVLTEIAKVLGADFPSEWVIWETSASHKERAQLYRALKREIPDLVAISLRDRDDEPVSTTSVDLSDGSASTATSGFVPLKWRRRHIENYLLVPAAIERLTGLSVADAEERLARNYGLAIADGFLLSDCPDALRDAYGKAVLVEDGSSLLAGSGKKAHHVAAALLDSEVCEDFSTFFERLSSLGEAG